MFTRNIPNTMIPALTACNQEKSKKGAIAGESGNLCAVAIGTETDGSLFVRLQQTGLSE